METGESIDTRDTLHRVHEELAIKCRLYRRSRADLGRGGEKVPFDVQHRGSENPRDSFTEAGCYRQN